MQRSPDTWPERTDGVGQPGPRQRASAKERQEEPPQKQRGSAAVGLGQSMCLHFDVCRMNLFSSNRLTSLLGNDTEITSELVWAFREAFIINTAAPTKAKEEHLFGTVLLVSVFSFVTYL